MDTMLRCTYFWPHMAADVTTTVRSCVACTRNSVKLRKCTNPLQLFPSLETFHSVAIDHLGLLPLTKGTSVIC